MNQNVFFKGLAIILLIITSCKTNQIDMGIDNEVKRVGAYMSEFTYMGRVEISKGKARYNWPGVSVFTQFSGQKLGVELNGGENNYFNVWIDDCEPKVICCKKDTVWWYPENLSKGIHSLRIVKRTEANMGMAIFSGLYIGKSDSLIKENDLPERKMLFLGNSITCGYGTEGKNKMEKFHPSTENCEKSYATILSRALNAQYHLIAHSGLGMVRNYGYAEKLSPENSTMPVRFNYLFDNEPASTYKMNEYQPHAVVVNLGSNDYSTEPVPDEKDFVEAGINLIAKIHNTFPNTHIFCITGPLMHDPIYTYTKRFVELYKQNTGIESVIFIGLPLGTLNDTDDLGSDWHPSYKGQLKTAKQLVGMIADKMNWDYSTKEFENHLPNLDR